MSHDVPLSQMICTHTAGIEVNRYLLLGRHADMPAGFANMSHCMAILSHCLHRLLSIYVEATVVSAERALN